MSGLHPHATDQGETLLGTQSRHGAVLTTMSAICDIKGFNILPTNGLEPQLMAMTVISYINWRHCILCSLEKALRMFWQHKAMILNMKLYGTFLLNHNDICSTHDLGWEIHLGIV